MLIQGVLGLLCSILLTNAQINMVENNELYAFMEAVRQQENAGGDYLKKHKKTQTMTNNGLQTVQAYGAYGILDINWDAWAKQAGYEGADWRIPVIQDIVAANKIQEYHNNYGSWDLVAVAWYGGPGKADIAMNSGMDAVGDIENLEGFGPNIKTYVNKVMNTYESEKDKPQPDMNIQAYAELRNKDSFFTTAYNPQGEILDAPNNNIMKLSSPDYTSLNREVVPQNDKIAKYGAEIIDALTPNRKDIAFELPEGMM